MAIEATTVEKVLAEIGSRQHGVVSRRQLLGTGVTSDEIQYRLGSGALLPVHRGVYRIGHRAPSLEARYMAAVLAGGDEAHLSGRAAAHLYGVIKGSAPAAEVSTPLKRCVPGVMVRRRLIDASERGTYRGIPVTTTLARTLVDLAAYLPLMPSPVPATRPGSASGRRRLMSRRPSRGGRTVRGRRSCASSCTATRPSPSARWSGAF